MKTISLAMRRTGWLMGVALALGLAGGRLRGQENLPEVPAAPVEGIEVTAPAPVAEGAGGEFEGVASFGNAPTVLAPSGDENVAALKLAPGKGPTLEGPKPEATEPKEEVIAPTTTRAAEVRLPGAGPLVAPGERLAGPGATDYSETMRSALGRLEGAVFAPTLAGVKAEAALRFQHGGRRTLFLPYYVTLPELSGAEGPASRKAARIFGISEERARAGAAEVVKFVEELLGSGQVEVFTRWERESPNRTDSPVLAVVLVGGRPLQEILVEKGWAAVNGPTVGLPDGTRPAEHLRKLRGLEREAREAGRGFWKGK